MQQMLKAKHKMFQNPFGCRIVFTMLAAARLFNMKDKGWYNH